MPRTLLSILGTTVVPRALRVWFISGLGFVVVYTAAMDPQAEKSPVATPSRKKDIEANADTRCGSCPAPRRGRLGALARYLAYGSALLIAASLLPQTVPDVYEHLGLGRTPGRLPSFASHGHRERDTKKIEELFL